MHGVEHKMAMNMMRTKTRGRFAIRRGVPRRRHRRTRGEFSCSVESLGDELILVDFVGQPHGEGLASQNRKDASDWQARCEVLIRMERLRL